MQIINNYKQNYKTQFKSSLGFVPEKSFLIQILFLLIFNVLVKPKS